MGRKLGFEVARTIRSIKNQGGFLLIIARLINISWFFFKWGLVLGVVVIVAAIPFFYRQVDEQIRRQIEDRFAQHYPGLKVTVRSAEFVAGKGIKVCDLVIEEPSAEGPCAKLITIEELFLASEVELKELVLREPTISRVVVRRPTLRITRRPGNRWSASQLLPLPKFGNQNPTVAIENGIVELFDPLKSPAGTLTFRDVNLSIRTITVPTPSGVVQELRELEGMLVNDHFRQVDFRGTFDPHSMVFSVGGKIRGMNLTPELRDSLPEPITEKCLTLGELRAEGQCKFDLCYDPAQPTPFRFNVEGHLVRGRFSDPRYPYPLTDLEVAFRADNSQFIIDDLRGKSNQSGIHMTCRVAGYEPNSPKTITAEIRQFKLDWQLRRILPLVLQEQWDKYRPIGEIDADLKMVYDGRTWQPDLSLRCLNVSITHYKFPYRIDRGNGTLTLKNDRLKLNLTAYSGNQPIHMSADVVNATKDMHDPVHGPTGWFTSQGEEIPVDDALLNAIPKETRAFVSNLQPTGKVNFFYRMAGDVPGVPWGKHLTVNLNHCSIRYKDFPYPINAIVGRLEMNEDVWTFQDLIGFNNTARITGHGSLRPSMQGRTLELHLTGKDVRFEKDLRDALPPKIQRLWLDLKPIGEVNVETDLVFSSDGEKKQKSVTVHVAPQSDTTSIEPVFFPYRLEIQKGDMYYQNGQVTLQNFRSKHGNVTLSTEGIGSFQSDGPWEMQLKGFTVERLDRDFLQALPERLRKAVLSLNPSGTMNVRGNLNFFHSGLPSDPLRSAWDMQIALFQNSLQCGIKLDNLVGTVTLNGQYDGHEVQSRGELALDSVHFKGYQFTNLTGPLWIDNQRVLFGSWVDQPNPQNTPPAANPPRSPRPLSANLLGGVVKGDGWIDFRPDPQNGLNTEPRYGLNAVLSEADVSKVLEGRQNLRGKLDANLGLQGSGSSRNGMTGNGSIRLSDAYLYDLPSMVAMLKLLSIRAPDRNAFSNIDIAYKIAGETIYFNPINFRGDAISLLGSGEMDWQSNLNVNFRAIVGRDEIKIPMFKEILTGANRGMMVIHVGGTMQKPDVTSEVLPGINQALQQLQERRQ